MAKTETSLESFSKGLQQILRADPKLVKAAMEQEKRERAEGRIAKREELLHDTDS